MIDSDNSNNARVLVVGGGGREHALAWKLSQSREVSKVFVAPGNAGTRLEPSMENLNIRVDDYDGIISFAEKESIDLTIVGPEQPLADGLVDRMRERRLVCCGPLQQAAQLESSKIFCKEFLQRHAIATARAESFTDHDQALASLTDVNDHEFPLVVKADGLAAGKGVIIAQDRQQAQQALHDFLVEKRYGDTGVLLEQFLEGEEVSYIVLTDGQTILPLASSQDHKKRDEQDRGPNTGGMGAYSPAPLVDDRLNERIIDHIIQPTIAGLRADGISYSGFLYAGLMIDRQGKPRVLEYNCRLGDPETQALMMRIEDGLYPALYGAATGNLANKSIRWTDKTAVTVVLAAKGYPEQYVKGEPIQIATNQDANNKVFHAGTRLDESGNLLSNGGRVLAVTSLGDEVADARNRVYDTIAGINWSGGFYRKDIGYRAIKRL